MIVTSKGTDCFDDKEIVLGRSWEEKGMLCKYTEDTM